MAATRARRGDAPGTNLDAEARLALLEAILAEARGHRGAILETGLRRALPLLFAAAASRTFIIQDHRAPLVPTATTPEESMPSSPRATTPATPRPAATDDDDDGFECLGSISAEARAVESRRAAAAESASWRSRTRRQDHPRAPRFMPLARGRLRHAPRLLLLARGPLHLHRSRHYRFPCSWAAARRGDQWSPRRRRPSYGMRVGNQGDSGPRPVDEDADTGLWADY